MYDSTEDTEKHIETVQLYLRRVRVEIDRVSKRHDASKLKPPEKELYDEYTPKLSSVVYGSDEYKQYLAEMGEVLQHHYKVNRHHPEHFENGINGMTLIDLVEMFCDWVAAAEKKGSPVNIEYLAERFGIGKQLFTIFDNTL